MSIPELSDREKAELLIAEINKALAAGTKHFSKSGQPLNTVREIVEVLARDGTIRFETSEINKHVNPYAGSFNFLLR